MNWKHTLGAIALVVIGAAYGQNIPGIKQAAKMLPGSNVV